MRRSKLLVKIVNAGVAICGRECDFVLKALALD